MKKAKVVEIPQDRELTKKEFDRLRSHVFNSASWYALEQGLNEGQIREKLRRKGFVEEDVPYLHNDEVVWHNFIDTVIAELQERSLLDEHDYARRLMSRCVSRGFGAGRIRQEFLVKKVPSDVGEEILADLEQDEVDVALMRMLARGRTSYGFRKNEGNPFAQEQYLRKMLMGKGFGWDDISRAMEQQEE